ncbi:uncharacterized protein LOC132706811 isoform X2 [Cylas formicarius]|nr:uncharacterized protein LOC132706811 isoform X2 [Cylas formicarius]
MKLKPKFIALLMKNARKMQPQPKRNKKKQKQEPLPIQAHPVPLVNYENLGNEAQRFSNFVKQMKSEGVKGKEDEERQTLEKLRKIQGDKLTLVNHMKSISRMRETVQDPKEDIDIVVVVDSDKPTATENKDETLEEVSECEELNRLAAQKQETAAKTKLRQRQMSERRALREKVYSSPALKSSVKDLTKRPISVLKQKLAKDDAVKKQIEQIYACDAHSYTKDKRMMLAAKRVFSSDQKEDFYVKKQKEWEEILNTGEVTKNNPGKAPFQAPDGNRITNHPDQLLTVKSIEQPKEERDAALQLKEAVLEAGDEIVLLEEDIAAKKDGVLQEIQESAAEFADEVLEKVETAELKESVVTEDRDRILVEQRHEIAPQLAEKIIELKEDFSRKNTVAVAKIDKIDLMLNKIKKLLEDKEAYFENKPRLPPIPKQSPPDQKKDKAKKEKPKGPRDMVLPPKARTSVEKNPAESNLATEGDNVINLQRLEIKIELDNDPRDHRSKFKNVARIFQGMINTAQVSRNPPPFQTKAECSHESSKSEGNSLDNELKKLKECLDRRTEGEQAHKNVLIKDETCETKQALKEECREEKRDPSKTLNSKQALLREEKEGQSKTSKSLKKDFGEANGLCRSPQPAKIDVGEARKQPAFHESKISQPKLEECLGKRKENEEGPTDKNTMATDDPCASLQSKKEQENLSKMLKSLKKDFGEANGLCRTPQSTKSDVGEAKKQLVQVEEEHCGAKDDLRKKDDNETNHLCKTSNPTKIHEKQPLHNQSKILNECVDKRTKRAETTKELVPPPCNESNVPPKDGKCDSTSASSMTVHDICNKSKKPRPAKWEKDPRRNREGREYEPRDSCNDGKKREPCKKGDAFEVTTTDQISKDDYCQSSRSIRNDQMKKQTLELSQQMKKQTEEANSSKPQVRMVDGSCGRPQPSETKKQPVQSNGENDHCKDGVKKIENLGGLKSGVEGNASQGGDCRKQNGNEKVAAKKRDDSPDMKKLKECLTRRKEKPTEGEQPFVKTSAPATQQLKSPKLNLTLEFSKVECDGTSPRVEGSSHKGGSKSSPNARQMTNVENNAKRPVTARIRPHTVNMANRQGAIPKSVARVKEVISKPNKEAAKSISATNLIQSGGKPFMKAKIISIYSKNGRSLRKFGHTDDVEETIKSKGTMSPNKRPTVADTIAQYIGHQESGPAVKMPINSQQRLAFRPASAVAAKPDGLGKSSTIASTKSVQQLVAHGSDVKKELLGFDMDYFRNQSLRGEIERQIKVKNENKRKRMRAKRSLEADILF